MKKISDKKRALIVGAYKKNSTQSTTSIANKYKVSRSFVWKLLKSESLYK